MSTCLAVMSPLFSGWHVSKQSEWPEFRCRVNPYVQFSVKTGHAEVMFETVSVGKSHLHQQETAWKSHQRISPPTLLHLRFPPPSNSPFPVTNHYCSYLSLSLISAHVSLRRFLYCREGDVITNVLLASWCPSFTVHILAFYFTLAHCVSPYKVISPVFFGLRIF